MPESGREHYLFTGKRWGEKAEENVDEWGLQDVDTLLLAMQEELGELTQAHLEARTEDGDPDRIVDELDDLGALCFQLGWALNSRQVKPETAQNGGGL